MRVGEDGWKAWEMPSHGATVHKSLGSPLNTQGTFMGYISLDGAQWTTENWSSWPAAEKSRVVWSGREGLHPSWHRLQQHQLPLPR